MHKEKYPIFQKILFDISKKYIIKELQKINVTEKYDNRALNGLCNYVVRILKDMYSYPHYNKGIKAIDGYHIDSTIFRNLKLNKLCKYFIEYSSTCDGDKVTKRSFPFFLRAERSTYHRNNSRTGYNGYAHWYVPGDLIIKILNHSISIMNQILSFEHQYGNKEQEYINKLKTVLKIDLSNEDTHKYLKIHKNKIKSCFIFWKNGKYLQFSTIINNAVGIDGNYICIKNNIKETLNGKGRKYTILGSISKEFRKFLLEDYIEIDLSSGIQTVLVNLYYNKYLYPNRYSSEFKKEFPMHHAFLTYKNKFRKNVSKLFNCNLEMAKKILTSISYSPNSRIIHKYCTQRNLSPERTLKCKKFIEPFIEEAKILRDTVLLKYYENDEENKKIIDFDIQEHNKTLKGNGRGKSLKDRKLFRLYTIYEKQIRDAMIEYLIFNDVENIYQLHDCVIFDKNIDLSNMPNYIYKYAKFNCKFSKEIY